MSKYQPTNHDAATHEELVAYLDGELSAAERQRIEQRLASDPDYRRQLSGLQQSWELLEVLPRATSDHQLTQTTIAMVAKDQHEQTRRRGSGAGRWTRAFPSRGLSVVAAAMIGFMLVSVPMRIWRYRTLRDLPIAGNVELYRYAEDIEFLELLQSEGMFAEDESNDH
jgi:anti-sigma factor RsiW